MIIHVTGDLLGSDCAVIAHGCNCFHIAGAGIAAQIRAKYPEAYLADLKTKKGDSNKLGEICAAYTRADGDCIMVVNCFTQFRPGREANLAAIKSSLEKMREHVLDEFKYFPKVGIPRIGCGIGGLLWQDVGPVVEDVFSDHDIYVYTLQP